MPTPIHGRWAFLYRFQDWDYQMIPRVKPMLVSLCTPLALGPFAIGLQYIKALAFDPCLSEILLSIGLLISCYTDCTEKKIRNWVTYPITLWAISLAALSMVWESNLSGVTFGGSLLGGAACFSMMLFVYLQGGCGAGDVKLALAIGAVVGWEAGTNVLLLCHMIAATYLSFIVLQHFCFSLGGSWRLVFVGAGFAFMQTSISTLKTQLQRPMPMAAFFAAGYFLTILGWRFI